MFRIREIYVRWIGIPVVALLITVFVKHTHDFSFMHKLFVSFVMTAYFWNIAFFVFIYFRKRFPEIRQTPKRLLITVVTLSVVLVFGGVPIRLILGLASFEDLKTLDVYISFLGVSFTTSVLVGTVYEAVYFFENWHKTIQINEALKIQQIRTQFEVLQNQMSPHFLFNSLNTLTALIAENHDIAIEFTQKLSDVYRYILQHKDKELVRLSEELEFVRDYMFLLQMRYPDNLHVNMKVDNVYQRLYIAPLTIQMLVENAIKHNVISRKHPLTIDIYVENGKSVVVKNNLMLKTSIKKSTKTGLENIKKRYEYLGQRKIDIITTTRNFMVAIPLIKLVKEKDFTETTSYESIDH